MLLYWNKKRTHHLVLSVIATTMLIYFCFPYLYGSLLLHSGAFVLEQPNLESSQLGQATNTLRKAAEILPNEPLVLRYLARAYQRSGQIEEAFRALEKAADLSPNSLLIRKELFLAYQKAKIVNPELSKSEYQFDYTVEQAIAAGDADFIEGNLDQALIWYNWIAETNPDHISKIEFRRLLTMVLLNDEMTSEVLRDSVSYKPVRLGHDLTVIPGANLKWVGFVPWPSIEFGTDLASPNHGSEGVFWWDGRGSVIVEVTEPARYMIRFVVREIDQRPVDMAFGVNGEQIHQALISKYDNLGTAIVELIVPLQPPAATIDVWYLHDRGDAVITQIEIARHSQW